MRHFTSVTPKSFFALEVGEFKNNQNVTVFENEIMIITLYYNRLYILCYIMILNYNSRQRD